MHGKREETEDSLSGGSVGWDHTNLNANLQNEKTSLKKLWMEFVSAC